MNNGLNRMIEKASWKKALLFTLLFALFYVVINFTPVGVAGLVELTGGPSILDMETGYSAGTAYEMLTALGEEGRAFYAGRIQPLDVPFPVTYMLCYIAWIALLLKQLCSKGPLRYLLLVPVLAMLADWAENVGIFVLLRGYPMLPAWAVALASIAGILKMTFVVGSLGAIVGLLAGVVVRGVRR